MRRVRRCSQTALMPTRSFGFFLFLYFPFCLEPVPQRSAVERTFALPEFEGARLDPPFAFVVHDQPSPKNDRTAITTTTKPTR